MEQNAFLSIRPVRICIFPLHAALMMSKAQRVLHLGISNSANIIFKEMPHFLSVSEDG